MSDPTSTPESVPEPRCPDCNGSGWYDGDLRCPNGCPVPPAASSPDEGGEATICRRCGGLGPDHQTWCSVRTFAGDPPASADEGARQRPGGWVDGVGWVASWDDLARDDLYTVNGSEFAHPGVSGDQHDYELIVRVTRWADGTTPAPPAPSTPAPHADAATIEAWLMEGGPDGMAHWLYAPDHLAADDYEGDDPMSEADLVLFRQMAARKLGERLALKFAATPPSTPAEPGGGS